MKLRADLVPLHEGQWRLISPDGSCCTLHDPTEQTIDALRSGCHGYPVALDGAFEQSLASHQLLSETLANGQALVIGGGLAAAETTLALAQTGAKVLISAPEPSLVALDPLGFHTSAASAVRAWVTGRCPAARIETAPHWTSITPVHASIVIVATATVQPDRAITDHLSRQRIPHLVVRAHHDLATIGPLVDASGPCLACLDLTQADHDQFWPATLAALITRPSRPTTMAAHWAGAQAAIEATWFMQGAGTTLRASTIEVDAAHAGVARRRWQPHSDCACQCPPALLAQAA